MLSACSTPQPSGLIVQTARVAPSLPPMGPVPRLKDPQHPTAADLMQLDLDLYQWAGSCQRKLHTVLDFENMPIGGSQ